MQVQLKIICSQEIYIKSLWGVEGAGRAARQGLILSHPAPGKCENILNNWKWVKEIIVHLSV